jgi:hypothetical protein
VAKFSKGKTGPDYFRGALELLHATYIGYHGYAHEWLADNPELTRELLNRCGYWLFPKAIELPEKILSSQGLPIRIAMENRGVAPPYMPYELRVKVTGSGKTLVHTLGRAQKSWLPGTPVSVEGQVPLRRDFPPGACALSVGLFDVTVGKERPVEFGLKASARDQDGYYELLKIQVHLSY